MLEDSCDSILRSPGLCNSEFVTLYALQCIVRPHVSELEDTYPWNAFTHNILDALKLWRLQRSIEAFALEPVQLLIVQPTVLHWQLT